MANTIRVQLKARTTAEEATTSAVLSPTMTITEDAATSYLPHPSSHHYAMVARVRVAQHMRARRAGAMLTLRTIARDEAARMNPVTMPSGPYSTKMLWVSTD